MNGRGQRLALFGSAVMLLLTASTECILDNIISSKELELYGAYFTFMCIL